jgi:glycosyltransferase involved in cell wall biosynthesis
MVRYAHESLQWPARPRFSVLMPVYCPKLPMLEQAIASVLDQTYSDWELCIVDDGSPEVAHIGWLETLARREPRVRFLRRSSNGGIAVATNEAIGAATGAFCVFLDQDDLLAKSCPVRLRRAGGPATAG